MRLSPHSRVTLGVASMILSAAAAFAQAASVPQAQPRKVDDDVLSLSEFTVSESNKLGYVASESMTGTRVATQIKDLPFSVNVLTNNFLDDFAIFEIDDNVAYISGFTGLDQSGSFNLRGFSSSYQLRDGFFRLGRYGSSNVDRIEVIKGPNAAIYGQTSPGGMVNMISKRPRKSASQKLSVNVGGFDTNRETFEATGPLGFWGKTNYITTLGFYERKFDTEMASLRNKEAYVALQHYFADNSNLLVSLEYFFRQHNSPISRAPIILDDKNTTSTADDQILGVATELGTLQQNGLNSELNRGMVFLNGIYEKRINSVWSTRIAANYYQARRWDFNQNTPGTSYNQRTGIIQRTAAPSRGVIFEDGGVLQADVLAQYLLFNRKMENRTLLTIDFNDYYRYDATWTVSGSALSDYWTPIRNITVGQPVNYYPYWYDWNFLTRSANNKNRTTVIGSLLRQQTALLNGRLLLFGGARYDKISYDLKDLRNARSGTFDLDQFNPNYGVNYKLTSQLSVYANASQSFMPNQQSITAALISPTYKSETAKGYDYGFKGSYLDNRLNFTAAAYYIVRNNVLVSEIDPANGSTITLPDGSHLVRGMELDVNWGITDDLTFGGSYGHVDSRITDYGLKYMSVGRSPSRVTPDNFGIYTRYAPHYGFLKGLSANLGVTYLSRTTTEGPDSGDTYTNGVFVRSTGQWAVTIPSTMLWNLGVRYALPKHAKSGTSHSIGFNINNAFDRTYLKPNKMPGDRRAVYFNYTISH